MNITHLSHENVSVLLMHGLVYLNEIQSGNQDSSFIAITTQGGTRVYSMIEVGGRNFDDLENSEIPTVLYFPTETENQNTSNIFAPFCLENMNYAKALVGVKS